MKALLQTDPRMVDAVLSLEPEAARERFYHFESQTPLIFAAGLQPTEALPEVLGLLIDAESDVNLCDANGCTALAALCKGQAARRRLVSPVCGPGFNLLSSDLASWLDRLPPLPFMLDDNIDLGTVLKAAAKLLNAGADPNLPDANGQTALDHAKLAEQKPLEQLLRNYQGAQALILLNRAAAHQPPLDCRPHSSQLGRLSDGLVHMICSYLIEEGVGRRVCDVLEVNPFMRA